MTSFAVVACAGGDAAPAERSAARDSAGVRIVENRAPAWEGRTAWRVDSAPIFEIDDATTPGDAADFQHVVGVLRLSDGSVVVLDRAEPFVRAFDATGALRWSAIGRGSGPGELEAPALLSRIRGDSIVVDDGATPRALLLSPAGEIAGDLPGRLVPAPGGVAGRRPLHPDARLADGALVGAAMVMPPRAELDGEGMVPVRWPAYVFARDGERTTELGALPRGMLAQSRAPSVHVLFGARATFAPRGDGFLFGFPSGDDVLLYDAGGSLRSVVRTPGGRRMAGEEEVAAGAATFTRVSGTPGRAPLRPDQLLVDSLPAYGRVVAGTDGTIWRERFDPAAPPAGYGLARTDAGATWDVHDADGRWLGPVGMPRGLYLTDAGADWVAGIHTGDDDVQTPRVYRVGRGR